jgi:hypothetical protein
LSGVAPNQPRHPERSFIERTGAESRGACWQHQPVTSLSGVAPNQPRHPERSFIERTGAESRGGYWQSRQDTDLPIEWCWV